MAHRFIIVLRLFHICFLLMIVFSLHGTDCGHMKNIMVMYKHASSLVINLQKSGIFFRYNCTTLNKDYVASVLSGHNSLDHGIHLGLTLLLGEGKKCIFSFLKDSLWKRVSC